MPVSRNCSGETTPGASVSGQCADCVFGNAMTSRIESAPAISMTIRSSPNAMPPCGGQPYCSARSRKPNFSSASSSPMSSRSNTAACMAWSWIRIEPPPTSEPFSTMS